jgi:CRISPR-associated protein Cmr4
MANTRIYWLHTLSPTHAGVGRGVGYIDLPIDRDGVTGWPIIRGSAFKGVWRDWAVQKSLPHIELAFGRADKDGETANSGALMPTDAKLVCLPVRSFRGTFAWCTSSLCMEMLRRLLQLTGKSPLAPAQEPPPEDSVYVCEGSSLLKSGNIYLEDLDFRALPNPTTCNWADDIARWVFPGDAAWQFHFKKRFVVLPDTAFDFLCETGTEVHTRVRIDDNTKTVAERALWTEEALPAETILAGIVPCDRVFQKKDENQKITEAQLLESFANESLTLQIGGKATVGRGQVRCVFTL